MKAEGNCGRSARHYGDEMETLRGVLTDGTHEPVYPEDACLQCLREGKVKADERCFHRHWETTTQMRVSERRNG